MNNVYGPTRRDAAFTALLFGFVGLSWFGWAQAAATSREAVAFGIGSAIAGVLLIAGGVVTVRLRREPGRISDSASGRRFGIIAGIEFGSAGLGAALLGATGRADDIPAWIAFVVGVHFIPLASLFRDRGFVPLGWALAAAATVAAVIAIVAGTPTSTTAAPAAGALLVAYGWFSLARLRSLALVTAG